MSVDIERLNSIFCGDKASLNQFIKAYIDSSNKLLLDIELEANKMDFEAIRIHIHTLKGSSGNSGMVSVYDMALKLDKANEEKNVEKLFLIINDIRDALYKISEKFA